MYFGHELLRKIGGFDIFEIVTNPEKRRRAVSPACPAIAFRRRRKRRRRGEEAPVLDRGQKNDIVTFQRSLEAKIP